MAKILLIAILVLSFFLRFYRLDSIPASLNPDEKFNAYTAYSLLKTGQDLRGNSFPVALKSFGSWTLIGYPALNMLTVYFLGLTEMAARLPAAIISVLGTAIIYLLAYEMFSSRRAALISALFFAVSPWGVFLSRISHETVVGAVLFLTGFLFLIKRRYISAALFLGLSLLTHYAYMIFVPAFLVTLAWFYRPSFLTSRRAKVSAMIFGLFVAIVALTIVRGSFHEVSDVGLFDSRDLIYRRVERFLSDGGHNTGDILTKIHNRYLGVGLEVAENYAGVFSPAFLFDKGGESLLHNLAYFGNLYITDFFLILAGIFFLCWRRSKAALIILFWAAVGPLASIFTRDTPSSTRLFPMLPMFIFLSAYGLSAITGLFSSRPALIRGLVAAFSAGFFTLMVLMFTEFYFVHLNVQRARYLGYGQKELVAVTNKYPGYKVVMWGPDNFPDISFLFYNTYDPAKFRREVSYYPLKGNGFQYVKSFGRYEFVTEIDRTKPSPGVLYIDKYRFNDKKNLIFEPSGEPIFTYFTASDVRGSEVR